MTTRRHQLLAAAFACLVTTSTVVLASPMLAVELADATDDDDDDDDASDAVDAELHFFDDDEADESPTELIVNFEPAKTAHGTDRGSLIEDLQAHADWTQQRLIDWADQQEDVTVENRFWLANAVLLGVDGDIDPSEIPGDHVRDIHPNYDVDLYEPTAAGSISGSHEGDPDGAVTDAVDDAGPDTVVPTTADDVTYGLDRLNAQTVWEEYETRGEGADVAVLDTGVDPDHPDITIDEDNWAHFDRSGDRKGTSPQDGNGHGTHTSGTVTGAVDTDGDVPSFGVAPDATLHHGKVLTDRGGGNFARIVAGMEWAVEQDADVISMSLGVRGAAEELIEPSEKARDAGVLVAASAGNSGDGTSGSPANIPVNFAIGASDENDDIARFSSGEEITTDRKWGSSAPEEWPDEYVVPDVAAPGVDVLSATPGGGYDEKSGTSMAAPHVAGAAALIASATDADREGIESALVTSAEKPDDWDEPDDEPDTRYGLGVIDAAAAVDHAADEHGQAHATDATPDYSDAPTPWDGFSGGTAVYQAQPLLNPDMDVQSHRRRLDGEASNVGVAT